MQNVIFQKQTVNCWTVIDDHTHFFYTSNLVAKAPDLKLGKNKQLA